MLYTEHASIPVVSMLYTEHASIPVASMLYTEHASIPAVIMLYTEHASIPVVSMLSTEHAGIPVGPRELVGLAGHQRVHRDAGGAGGLGQSRACTALHCTAEQGVHGVQGVSGQGPWQGAMHT
jgi:hypothetical protein